LNIEVFSVYFSGLAILVILPDITFGLLLIDEDKKEGIHLLYRRNQYKRQGRSNWGVGAAPPPNNFLIILFSKSRRPLSILSFISFKRLHYP
jgi:hypothetical protein